MSGRRLWATRLRPWGVGLLFLAPAAILLLLFRVLPLWESITLSLSDWNGFGDPDFIGLRNFERLFNDSVLRDSLVHNLLVLAALPLWVVMPYLVALSLHTGIRGSSVFRAAFFLPAVLSPVVIGVYYNVILAEDGPFNDLLTGLGLGAFTRPWLADPQLALPITIAIVIWSSFGIGVIIYLAGLSNIDQEPIDAAVVDGANWVQVQRHVVLWQMLPVFGFWSLLVMLTSFLGLFPLIYSLTDGGPGRATYVIDFTIFYEAFRNGRYGYASAISVALIVVIAAFGLAILGIRRMRRHSS